MSHSETPWIKVRMLDPDSEPAKCTECGKPATMRFLVEYEMVGLAYAPGEEDEPMPAGNDVVRIPVQKEYDSCFGECCGWVAFKALYSRAAGPSGG